MKYNTILILLSCLFSFNICYSGNKSLDFNINGQKFKMVYVDGGSFYLGVQSKDSLAPNYLKFVDPRSESYKLSVDPFYIGETEVTQALYEAVMGSNPSQHKDGGKCPVDCVSWYDCNCFCMKLNMLLKDQLPKNMEFSLPTEAQWEYAAKGGRKSKGYAFSGSNNIDDVAWYSSTTEKMKAIPFVAQKKPNELGLYDMTGNIGEWCLDFFCTHEDSVKGYMDRRAVKGGSWGNESYTCYPGLRTSTDFLSRPFHRRGFRLALTQSYKSDLFAQSISFDSISRPVVNVGSKVNLDDYEAMKGCKVFPQKDGNILVVGLKSKVSYYYLVGKDNNVNQMSISFEPKDFQKLTLDDVYRLLLVWGYRYESGRFYVDSNGHAFCCEIHDFRDGAISLLIINR